MEKYDELISTIKTECRDDIALSLLLYDGHIDEAIEYAFSSDSLNPSVIIETAKAAKDKEKNTDAVSLTFKVIKKGIIEVDENFVGEKWR